MYSPLPKELTIQKSKIQGLGLFAKCFIPFGTQFGMTHLKIGSEIIRTPLGGFINHSENPNCVKSKIRVSNYNDLKIKQDYVKWTLAITKDIKAGEELTCEYTFYKMEK